MARFPKKLEDITVMLKKSVDKQNIERLGDSSGYTKGTNSNRAGRHAK